MAAMSFQTISPEIKTEAPIIGSLSSADITVPDTSIWANAAPMLIKRQTKKSESLFSIISRLILNYYIIM